MRNQELSKKLDELKKTVMTDMEICQQLVDEQEYAKWENHFLECFDSLGDSPGAFKTGPDGQYDPAHAEARMYAACSNLMEYLNITTYDGDLDREFTRRYIPVLEAIAVGRTYAFMNKGAIQEQDYVLTASFLATQELISWGTSIRGAWFDAPRKAITPGQTSYDGSPVINNSDDCLQLFLALIRFTRKFVEIELHHEQS